MVYVEQKARKFKVLAIIKEQLKNSITFKLIQLQQPLNQTQIWSLNVKENKT